jgi:membrane-associated phospholipid phosphatase
MDKLSGLGVLPAARAPSLFARVEVRLAFGFWAVAGVVAAMVTAFGAPPADGAPPALQVYALHAAPLVGLAAAWPLLRRWRHARVLLDWLPLGLVLLTYEMLHVLVPACWGPWTIDPVLSAADRALFGDDLARVLEPVVSLPLTLLMALFYASYYVMPVSLGLYWYLRRRRTAFRELIVGEVGALFIGYLGYMFLPAVGPHAFLPPGALGPALEGNFVGEWIAARNPARGGHFARDAFPSLHTANAVTLVLVAWRHEPRVLRVYLPLVLGLVAATMYLRFHFAVDVLAGAALAVAWQWFVPGTVAREAARERRPVAHAAPRGAARAGGGAKEAPARAPVDTSP